jgi:hypothetical protein
MIFFERIHSTCRDPSGVKLATLSREHLRMRRVIKILGVGAGAIISGFGLYLLIHDCLILAYVMPPYGEGPAGLIVGPALVLIGAVAVLALLEKTLFPR